MFGPEGAKLLEMPLAKHSHHICHAEKPRPQNLAVQKFPHVMDWDDPMLEDGKAITLWLRRCFRNPSI